MGAAVGGSLENVAIKGRLFAVAADASVNRKLGGFENAVESNGDGTARIIKTRVPWSASGVQLEINDARGDQEFLQDIANAKDFVPVELTFASGSTWTGRGIITDAIEFDSQKSTAQIAMMGPANISPQ